MGSSREAARRAAPRSDGRERRRLPHAVLVVSFVVLLLAIFLFPPACLRHLFGTVVDVACEVAMTVASTEAPSDDATGHQGMGEPAEAPLSYELVMTGRERLAMSAMRESIATGSPAPADPVTLLALSSVDMKGVADALYSDSPELSLLTDGELLAGDIDLYGGLLPEPADEDDLAEMAAVRRRADELSEEMSAEVDGIDEALRPRDVSPDYLYACRVCQRLGMTTTYSDGIGDSPHANDMYGALVEGESKCYGLATAAKALLDRRGIPSFVATGSTESDPSQRHAVAIAWIDGQWRIIDATVAQGKDVPEDIRQGVTGYWGNIAMGEECYVQQTGFVPDRRCADLMRAYEEKVGVGDRR